MSVYALPTTSAGTVLAACLLQGAGPAFPSDCERAPSTLQLGGTSAAGLGPSSSLGSALNRVVGKLNARVGGAQARLSSARRPAQQASAAATLSAAYGQAAASVRTLSAPP